MNKDNKVVRTNILSPVREEEFAADFQQSCHVTNGHIANRGAAVRTISISRDSTSGPREIWELSAPHYFLLTTVSGIPDRYNYQCQPPADNWQPAPNSLGIRDLLSPSFGEILESAQFNFLFDVDWMMDQYPASARDKPLLLVYGETELFDVARMQEQCAARPNIELCRADLLPRGTHHTKMMLLRYRYGMRVNITTANMVPGDWSKKTQGMWVSPLFPPGHGESASGFRDDLCEYLRAYNRDQLRPWIRRIRAHNMSSANVALIASVPGSYPFQENFHGRWGHCKLYQTLCKHAPPSDPSWAVIAQCSSIGSLGAEWLRTEFATSLAASCHRNFDPIHTPPVKLMFPSVDDVRCSLEGYAAGRTLSYRASIAEKQPWLPSNMQRWRAEHCGRTEAIPHIKSYCRLSSPNSAGDVLMPWFLLTSANLSKAAWGSWETSGTHITIRSFELGVLFLPKFSRSRSLLTRDTEYFRVKCHPATRCFRFPLPFSLPMTEYAADDEPWISSQ